VGLTRAHTRIALGQAAADLADHAIAVVTDVAEDVIARDRIRAARSLRLDAIRAVDLAVLVARADGESWDDLAGHLGYTHSGMDPDEHTAAVDAVRRTYEPVYDLWSAGPAPGAPVTEHDPGTLADTDLPGTAASLDSWVIRHTAGWAELPERAVSRVLDTSNHE